jgi:hypothetical protein
MPGQTKKPPGGSSRAQASNAPPGFSTLLEFFRLASRNQFRVDDGESFKHCHVAESLIGANEMIDRSHATYAECNCELNCVERAKLASQVQLQALPGCAGLQGYRSRSGTVL